MKLRDAIPYDMLQVIDSKDKIYKLLDIEVIKKFSSMDKVFYRWPGKKNDKRKHVFTWWLLENKIAVGRNEGFRGWGFPVTKLNQECFDFYVNIGDTNENE